MSSAIAVPQLSATTMTGTVTIREILFPTDLSPESDRAFAHAKLLAETFRARLTAFHAIEAPHPRFGKDLTAGDDLLRHREEATLRRVDRHTSGLTVPRRILVEPHRSAHRAIVEHIRTHQPDLVVMATHGREGLAHLFLGSVAEKVLQHARRPVLCVRQTGAAPRLPYRRIVVATDLSIESSRAFPWAARLGGALGATLVAVHVTATGEPYPDPTVVGRFLLSYFHAPVGVRLETGTAWERVVEAAAVEAADLVILSSRGADNAGDTLLGRHAERVVRHAPCPVLVV